MKLGSQLQVEITNAQKRGTLKHRLARVVYVKDERGRGLKVRATCLRGMNGPWFIFYQGCGGQHALKGKFCNTLVGVAIGVLPTALGRPHYRVWRLWKRVTRTLPALGGISHMLIPHYRNLHWYAGD